MILSRGDLATFVERPVSLLFLVLTLLILLFSVGPIRRTLARLAPVRRATRKINE